MQLLACRCGCYETQYTYCDCLGCQRSRRGTRRLIRRNMLIWGQAVRDYGKDRDLPAFPMLVVLAASTTGCVLLLKTPFVVTIFVH